jgi:hypothetical protein
VTPDTRLNDEEQLEEIELYGALVIAASAHDGPLTKDEVDEALGLHTPER